MRIKPHSNRFKRLRHMLPFSEPPNECHESELAGKACYQAMRRITRHGIRVQIRLWPGSTRQVYQELKKHVSSNWATR